MLLAVGVLEALLVQADTVLVLVSVRVVGAERELALRGGKEGVYWRLLVVFVAAVAVVFVVLFAVAVVFVGVVIVFVVIFVELWLLFLLLCY